MNPVIRDLQTAVVVADEIGMKGSCLIGIMLHEIVKNNVLSPVTVRSEFGEDVSSIITGLVKTNELYAKSPAIESENFRNLLLSFAEDMRVILIMIADRVNVMRQIKDSENEEDRIKVANEASYLYAPLAHKLGLYKLKSELEDLSLKYIHRDTYYFIKDKLNETKASRDKYIAAFIEPIQKKVKEAGLKFDIKGRTKSIHSIWNKIQKQKTPFEGIYDLFAIRIILDSDPDKEKQECWQAYSIVTDMYQPNPKRLRDWLSIPKSNGYESLHITVMGPEGKWVEVQIRTRRMDCPNADQMRERFGYRIVKARWAGKSQGTQYPITLRVVGHDDIGIVTNITSIISKENNITLRSIGIDSHDGLFSGTMTIMVGDTGRLEALIKKLRTVKGVKQVSRN